MLTVNGKNYKTAKSLMVKASATATLLAGRIIFANLLETLDLQRGVNGSNSIQKWF
jgi:hypothetical protein